MRELRTEIEIDAPPERVWQVLIDFGAYPQSNPLIRSIEGRLASAYGFAIGSIPFGSVEALWSIVALRRFAAFRPDIPGQRLTLN